MKRHILALAILVVIPACGGTDEVARNPDCPVTIPTGEFLQPAGYPEPRDGEAWFGTDELWTTLPLDGDYGRRKSVWWSTLYAGPPVEEQPEISVTWTRYGEVGPTVTEGPPGTNAYTTADGDFMIGGIDPEESGCWSVSASYRGATVTYTYFVEPAAKDT